MSGLNDRVRAALAKHANRDLNGEIEHYLSIDDDEQRERDYYDALEQAHDLAEYNGERATLTAARRCLIELGVFIPKTDEQIRNTVTLGGKKYAFQLDGTKYDFDKHPTRR